MPFFYDVNRAITTNASANTESTHLWGTTVANQETVSVVGLYAAARFATAGGAQARIKTNAGTVASGGTTQTAAPKNSRGVVAAQSVWKNDATAITNGTTLTVRTTVGFAQTGGQGGWIPLVPQDAFQMMPNALNPVDVEITSLAATASVTADLTLEIGEGV
jgi:hypothetical protein